MKRILAVADTHLREWKLPEKLLEMLDNADIVVHAGDFESYEVYKKFSEYNLYAVAGNSDDEAVREELENELTFEVEGLRFGLVHRGNFINQFHDLGYKAMELDVDVLVFGHLHRFVLEEIRGKLLICPGSPTQPRMSVASCAEIVVNRSKVDVRYHVVQPLFCGMDVYEKLEGCR
uniref:Phosphoesterase n=1 Tax=Archaeoglobus fulgidus TaxID=2234 RepID=A0A7C3RC42_ARCFL